MTIQHYENGAKRKSVGEWSREVVILVMLSRRHQGTVEIFVYGQTFKETMTMNNCELRVKGI